MTAALAPRRRQRLAVDLPAGPICALAALAPRSGPRAYVALRSLGDGRVAAEAGGGSICALLEVEGQLAQPLAIPAQALTTLGRRHPRATVLAIDGPPDGGELLRLLALDASGTATVQTPPASLAPGSVEALLLDPPLLPLGERAALLDPALLAQALTVLGRICPGPVLLALPAHDALGVLLTGRPDPAGDSGVAACAVAIARMVEAEP